MSVSIIHKEDKERSLRDLQRDNARYIWLQLLIDILVSIPHNDQTLDEMLDECQSYAKDDVPTRKAIDDLRYYTAATFLFKQFNRASRTENSDLLFVFRRFFVDTHQQSHRLYREQFLDTSTEQNCTLDLHHGQFMTTQEFQIIKEEYGCLISINSFISMTNDYGVAEIFAGFKGAKTANVLSVISYTLVEDTRHSFKRLFASIKEFSKMKDEEEILFSVGTLFRIDDVMEVPGNDQNFIVTLVLVNDESDNETTALRQELESEFCQNCDLSSLGAVLIKMGDYNLRTMHNVRDNEIYSHFLLVQLSMIFMCIALRVIEPNVIKRFRILFMMMFLMVDFFSCCCFEEAQPNSFTHSSE